MKAKILFGPDDDRITIAAPTRLPDGTPRIHVSITTTHVYAHDFTLNAAEARQVIAALESALLALLRAI